MKTIGLLAAFYLVCGLVFAAGSFAAERQYGTGTEGVRTGQVLPLTDQTIISQNQLIGMNVLDSQNRPVGEIQSLLLDIDRGQIAYVVLSPHSELAAAREFIVPWNALSPRDDALVVSVDRDRLDRAPAPRTTMDEEFGRQVHEFYGVAPYWQERVIPAIPAGPEEHVAPPSVRPSDRSPWGTGTPVRPAN